MDQTLKQLLAYLIALEQEVLRLREEVARLRQERRDERGDGDGAPAPQREEDQVHAPRA